MIETEIEEHYVEAIASLRQTRSVLIDLTSFNVKPAQVRNIFSILWAAIERAKPREPEPKTPYQRYLDSLRKLS